MSVAMRRLAPLFFALVLVAGVPIHAHAQVTIHMTTTTQQSCDVTTDASGLRLGANGTDLIATGVTLAGTGCGGSGILPPTPNDFALAISANPLTGSPFTVSWSVTGATSCSGSASLGGSSVSLAGWTDVTTPDSPRSVVATTAGTYSLSLTCSNTAGAATSQLTQVVVGQGSASNCPTLANGRTQATVSDLHYLPEPPVHVRRGVDITQWENIWGAINESDAPLPWPGARGASPTISTIGVNQYLSAQFTVPAVSPAPFGNYIDVSYGPGPRIDAAISTSCGDFSPADSACIVPASPPLVSQDQPFLHWKTPLGNTFYCTLAPNTTYYFNMQWHDLVPTGPGCTGTTCEITIQHYW